MPAVGHGSSSTIAQPVGSQTKPTILTRCALAVREMFFTSKDLEKPESLYRVVHLIQQNLARALRVLGSNPILSGNLCQGIVLASGTAKIVQHGLGRPYTGWIVVRVYNGVAASLDEVQPVDTGYPPGLTKSTALVLFPSSSTTVDVWVF